MKRLLLLAVLLLSVAPVDAQTQRLPRVVGRSRGTVVVDTTPTMVQYVSKAVAIGAGGAWSVGGGYICNFPNPTQAGNLLIVFFRIPGDWPIGNFTATDNVGTNTWVALKGSYNSTGDTMQAAFYALNVAAGTRTVTITQNTSTGLFGAQWMGAEFCNVTALDTSSSTTGSSATITTGSLTPTVTGDLLVTAGLRSTSLTTTSMTAGSQSNITWKLLGTNIFNGHTMQWGTYASTAAITPQLTMASTSQWNGFTLAFKAGTQGAARPAGMRVVGNTGIDYRPGDFATTQAIQFTAYGNLRIIGYVGGVAANAPTITAISDTESTTWTAAVTSVVDDSRVGMLYGANATANPASVVTMTLNVSTGDFTAQCLDVIGANVSPFDVGATNTGTQSVAGSNTALTGLTPTTSNGLCYGEMGVAFNTNTGMSSPSGGYFLSSTFIGQDRDGPSTPDENNAWGIYYNPNTSAINWTFTMKDGVTANGQWAAAAACFKS